MLSMTLESVDLGGLLGGLQKRGFGWLIKVVTIIIEICHRKSFKNLRFTFT